MAIRQKDMVSAGLRLLDDAGHKVIGDVPGAHHKATIKQLADGSSVQVRTCNLPDLPMVFTEKEARTNGIPDRLETALAYSYVLAVIRVAPNRISAFLIPSGVVKQYVLDQLEAGKADLSPHLEQDRWSSYRLGTIDVGDIEVDEAETDDGTARSAASEGGTSTIRSVIDLHRRNIARDAGVTPDKVRIEIDFN